VEKVATGLSAGLQQHFAEWIRSIPMPDRDQVPQLLTSLDKDAAYLTFNYTRTLTKLYDIAQENILHIHGEGEDESSDLVLGHARAVADRSSLQDGVDENTDTRFAEAMGILDDYFEKTFKPSAKIIEQQKPYFEGLKSITQVVVLGHSLSKVDEAYFLALVEALQASPRWTVAVRSLNENTSKAACLIDFGVPSQSIGFKLWSQL